ncbi:hypothetical protein PanWU01x14_105130, partial [Parasponia andersonii]
ELQTKLPELEDETSNRGVSTIVYNIYCEHLNFDFIFSGFDIASLVEGWREDNAKKATEDFEDNGAEDD